MLSILHRFGFEVHSQKSSHAKLRRLAPSGGKQTLTVPIHDEIDPGTMHAIVRQAARFIPEEELHSYFFTD